VHTLKGDWQLAACREFSELAHRFEDALSLEGAATQTAVAEIAFSAAMCSREMITAYHGGGKLPSTKTLSKKIADFDVGADGQESAPPQKTAAAATAA